jgi:hypothetical protein
MSKNSRYLFLGITLWTTFGCGKTSQTSTSQTLSPWFSNGRRIARSLPTGDANGDLFLSNSPSDPALIGYKTALDSDLILWALFDTTLNKDIDQAMTSDHARSYINANFEMFQLQSSDLSSDPRVIPISDRLLSISFARNWEGIPVRDANIEAIYARQDNGQYRLREIVNSGYGSISVENAQAMAPDWNEVRLLSAQDSLELISSRQVIFTKKNLNGPSKHSHASEFTVRNIDSRISFVITLEHETNSVLEAYQNLYTAGVQPLQASVFKRTYLDQEKIFKKLPLIQVSVGNNQIKANLDGQIDLGGATAATLRLSSERGQINLAQANTAYQVPAQITDEGAYTMVPAGDGLTGLNAYAALLEINSFVRRNINEEEAVILGQNTIARINVRGNCNAFYDPQVSAISLYAAGNGCANVAQVNDVIYHEWGHGLDNFTGKTPGITDGAFSEGIGDIVSGFKTNSNILAPGFLVNDATGIRNLDNTTKYPDNQGEVHAEGQIIGGAFWDMRKDLIERYGPVAGAAKAETIFFRHLLTTDTYLDSYQAAVRLDDDDGNPATPSPNYCLINAAFAKHGLAQNENCQDKKREDSVPIDETIAVGIAKSDDAGILLMAASAKAAQMSICLDTKEICFSAVKPSSPLEREGILNGKTTFLTGKPIKLKALQTVTLISRDSRGKPIGARMIRLVTK